MQLDKLKSIVISALDDLKGQDMKTIDVNGRCDFADLLVICSGTSNRHVKSLANNVVDEVKKNGLRPLGIEGDDAGDWILVDLGDLVVHVMQQEIRNFYQLEALWEFEAE